MEGRASAAALRESLTFWSKFYKQCILQRIDADKFDKLVVQVFAKHPLHPILIADIFLRPHPNEDNNLDPRIPPYIQVLSKRRYIDAASILKPLLKYSSSHALAPSQAGNAPVLRWKNSHWAEEVMFYHVIKMMVEGTAFREPQDALNFAKVISDWMNLFTAASTPPGADMLGSFQQSQDRQEMGVARAAFVPLLLRLVDNQAFLKAISKPSAKDTRKKLHASLAEFIPTLQPGPQFEVAVGKLELFRTDTLAGLDPGEYKKHAANAAMDELLDSTMGLNNFVIPDMPISNTRSGLYIYLNAALIGRPLLDDTALFSYLNNRYQGDTQSSAIDLIVASFDVLANAVFRNEAPKDAHLLRSYLVNKLPLLLRQLCPPEFSTTAAEFCITTALNQVDTSVFPTASLMFDESRYNNPYTESVREEFCAACALHGLVAREHVERILGEISMSYEPSREKHSKDKLVQNCLSDPEKIQGLVRELDKMDGNVGAVCQALVELMRQFCSNKDTMSLKLLCSQLVQKPLSLDVLLLFEKLPTVTDPLCQLLDNWRYDEDQGEYQPVYEEFGAILLLVLGFAYRYNLSAADMGMHSSDSYVAKILGRAHLARSMSQMTEQEKTHMNGWIQGLFSSEAGGLGDDLMSSCPPQDFYLLIATLFKQTAVAYRCGMLSDERLKSGVEYLVDTFLLPSLVPALLFLAEDLWVDKPEQKSIIRILQLILLPSSISGEASTMLTSVKNLVAKPLERSLRTYQRRNPKNQDVEPLLQALKDSLPLSRRTGGADINEIEAWVGASGGAGLPGAMKNQINSLVTWGLHPDVNYSVPSYTHRQVLVTCQIAGAKQLLRTILQEIRQQSASGSASVVYDVASAIICAPDVTADQPTGSNLLDENGNVRSPPQQRRTLRDALRVEAEDCKKIQKKDAELAEIVVRLYRRVEALMVMPQPQTMLQEADMSLGLGVGTDTGALGDAMVTATEGQDDAMAVDVVGLDMGMGSVSGDLGLGGPSGSGSGLDAGSDADPYGLGGNMDMFDQWDTMDMN